MNLKSAFQSVKKYGLNNYSREIVYQIVNKAVYFKRLQGMIIEVRGLDPAYLKGLPEYEYSFLTKEEILRYSQDETNEMSPDFIRNAFSNNDKCYGITLNGELASFGWYSKKPTRINDNLMLCFNEDWVYMYSGLTKRPYRGQRLHAIGMAKALNDFTEQGARGLISYVEVQNFRSLRSTARMGYQNIGRITILKVLGKYIISTDESCSTYGFTVLPTKTA